MHDGVVTSRSEVSYQNLAQSLPVGAWGTGWIMAVAANLAPG